MNKWETEQARVWREQEVARQAIKYCEKYLVEYINNHSMPSKFARSLARLSTNDYEIIGTVMSALEDIRPLEAEFEIKELSFVVHNIVMELHKLERFETKNKLVEELRSAGYR